MRLSKLRTNQFFENSYFDLQFLLLPFPSHLLILPIPLLFSFFMLYLNWYDNVAKWLDHLLHENLPQMNNQMFHIDWLKKINRINSKLLILFFKKCWMLIAT
jgi:hypothetical protein